MGIAVEGLRKRFGDFVALEDVSLEIPTGSLTALLGPSGSGKSTLLRAIAGLEDPDTGSIRIFGEDATHLPPQRRGVGFVFQHYAAFRHMNVRDNVAFGLRVRKRGKDETAAKVAELLHLVQLEGLAHRYPSQLSGGQRQRMALARALAVEPRVLLLDEPFGALDARVRADLRAWLRRLHDDLHVTTVLVTHDREEAMEIADRIAVLDAGRVQQVGSPREVYEAPANAFVMGFVGPVNRLEEGWVRPHDITLVPEADGARVERLVHLGFEVRVDLARDDGRKLQAQVTRDEAEQLGLHQGQQLGLRPRRERRFAAPEDEPDEALRRDAPEPLHQT
jgi:sulfate transport system ATP-binding protein